MTVMSQPVVALPPWRPTGRALRRLPVADCLALLSRCGVGRLAFTHGPTPVIIPVNFALDGTALVLRTADGTLLAGLPDGEGVALQVDHVDFDYHTGWSVLVRGRLDRIGDPAELARAQRLPLGVYAPGIRDEWRRISPATVSGRRIST